MKKTSIIKAFLVGAVTAGLVVRHLMLKSREENVIDVTSESKSE